ncbi:hypothetical protein [Streptomyces sp. NPDC088182]|uniref:hypothetical protein n=1 Tax=Streptomyces sp. NPDC088182 TaxID=3365838 RepID=UPI0037F947D7
MTLEHNVSEIAMDSSIPDEEKRHRIIEILSGLPERGVPAAIGHLMETRDGRVAEYVARYLQLIPDAREEKTRAAEHLRESGDLIHAAARLVPWLPESLLGQLVSDYADDPQPGSPLSNVLFSIAAYHPDLVRPIADRISSKLIRRSLLSGAPDELADALLARWHEGDEWNDLEAVARIRTRRAIDAIHSVRDELEDRLDWETLIALAGQLPDSDRSAGYHPSFMGFVTSAKVSPHTMGGAFPGPVPICIDCHAPAERVLTLSADELPMELSCDPSFLWYSCKCYALETVTVKIQEDGRLEKTFYGPQEVLESSAKPNHMLIPGLQSLTLERHPNQTGESLRAYAGWSRHQVGGLPSWIDPEPHPYCPECRKAMPFLTSLDSGPTPFGAMGFDGKLFGFWCDHCRISVTQQQE